MPRETGVSSGSGAAPPGRNAGARSSGWAAFVTGKIEALVSLIRDRAVDPVVQAVKYVVFGVVAVCIGIFLAVMFSIGLIRVLDEEVFPTRVWASYFVVAGIFSISGLFLLRMRRPRA